jgi:hypothetical protein
MLRRIGYRAAGNAFVFTALWFALGLILLWTPIPGALGIGGDFFVAWLLLFLALLALAGFTLCIAAVNGIFPPNVRAPRGAESLWAAPPTDAAPARRPAAASGPRASRPPHGG